MSKNNQKKISIFSLRLCLLQIDNATITFFKNIGRVVVTWLANIYHSAQHQQIDIVLSNS